jgi:hypothetical protein
MQNRFVLVAIYKNLEATIDARITLWPNGIPCSVVKDPRQGILECNDESGIFGR